MIKRRSFGIKRSPKQALRPRKRPVARRKSSKGIPVWLKTVPEGSHGSGTIQKRLWKLKSDYVRIRDWYQWGPQCISTGRILESWQEGHAGHFKSYARCNGIFKFDERNIHLQQGYGNKFPDRDDWKHYEEELIYRYGAERITEIETANAATDIKIPTPLLLKEIERTIELIKRLPEQPPYFPRLLHQIEQLKQ